jgi:hypothetical protein
VTRRNIKDATGNSSGITKTIECSPCTYFESAIPYPWFTTKYRKWYLLGIKKELHEIVDFKVNKSALDQHNALNRDIFEG